LELFRRIFAAAGFAGDVDGFGSAADGVTKAGDDTLQAVAHVNMLRTVCAFDHKKTRQTHGIPRFIMADIHCHAIGRTPGWPVTPRM